MALKLGYLLPTREQIMDGRPEAAPLLSLAERAERLGYDSIWVSLLARPRHFERTALVYPLRAGRPFAAFAWVGQVPGDFPRPVLGYLVRA